MAKTHSNIFNEQRSQHNELKHKRIPKNGTDFKNTYKHIRKARELAEHMKTGTHPIGASKTNENTNASQRDETH